MVSKDKEKIKEIMERGVERIIEEDSFKKKLESGKKLRIKHGVDPTGPKIHIGRAIQFWKLKEFQDLGHQVILILGDFTAQIGDASDKDAMRTPLTKEEVEENLKTYEKQIGKILDMKKTEVRRNSEWLNKLDLKKLIELTMNFTAQQMIQRRNFKERWENAKPIGVHELFYPILQGYDSAAIKADIELGGYDQLFNLGVGRDIQRMMGQSPQDIMTTEMLYGLDGRKMSTSWGNTITITEKPKEMFGKIMSMKDEHIIDYFRLSTKLPMKEIGEIKEKMKKGDLNPRDAKAKLAREVVKLYHSEEKAEAAEKEFEKVFREGELPSDIPVHNTSTSITSTSSLVAETGLVKSNSQAKRLIEQGGVKIDNKVVKDWGKEIKVNDGMIIQVGKRKFIKIKKDA